MILKEEMLPINTKEIAEQYLAVIEAIPQSEDYSLNESSLGSIAFWLDHLAYSDINWKETLRSILSSWKELVDDPVKIDLDLLERISEAVNEDRGGNSGFSYIDLFNIQTKMKKKNVLDGALPRVSCGGLPADIWPSWFLEVAQY